MKMKANTTDEFDRRFDEGEDICELIDMTEAKMERPIPRVTLTMEFPESLMKDIGEIGERMDIDPKSLIKVWLYERVLKEKAGNCTR